MRQVSEESREEEGEKEGEEGEKEREKMPEGRTNLESASWRGRSLRSGWRMLKIRQGGFDFVADAGASPVLAMKVVKPQWAGRNFRGTAIKPHSTCSPFPALRFSPGLEETTNKWT